MCGNGCGILVHVKDGVVTKVLGDPDNPHNNGFVCAKGQSGPQALYSPYRVRRPLVRTNPEKGLDVDPKWKEVTFDEVLTLVAENLRRVMADDPRKVMWTSFETGLGPMREYTMFMSSLGSPNFTPGSADFFCGNNMHTLFYLNNAASSGGVDLTYTKYLLEIGTQWGAVMSQGHTMSGTTQLAEARAHDRMKVVVIDPWCSFAGSKANEWIAIRPGTDGAFMLGLVNVIINELGKYDEQFLKLKTNAPYLVGEDRLYAKEARSNKPLIWDAVANKAKPFDDPSVKDFALIGEYVVDGKHVKPGFQLLKDHVKKYTPEWVSEITTIPPETTRRVAKEWVDNAHIGETIEVGGLKFPYRPVSVKWYRGPGAHKNSAQTGYAIMLLPTLMGAIDVPGGAMGEGRMAFEGTTEDGLLWTKTVSPINVPYPPREVTAPNSAFYFELFPIGPYSPVMTPLAQLNPETYKPPYKIEMLFQVKNNIVKSSGPTDMMEKWVKSISFTVSFNTTLDETATMSDVVIPDIYYLERDALSQMNQHPGIEGPLYQYMQHQAVPPPFPPPYDKFSSDVDYLFEIASKAGFLDKFYDTMNSSYGLKDPYRLQRGKRYSWKDVLDLRLKGTLGPEYGLEWFRKNNVIKKPKDAKMAYPGPFRKARIHLYYEFIERAGKEVERVTNELGIPWETKDYQALPEWKPCPSFNPKSKDYDLWIINSKLPTHTLSGSVYYPALQAVTGKHKLDKGVLMNASTAERKGIKYGDWVTIETETGKKARAIALVSEVVHPEVVVCFGSHGRRVQGLPNAKGLGIDFNQLLELDPEHIDFVNGALDSCIRIKVSKEES